MLDLKRTKSLIVVLLVGVSLGGCTPEKAKALQIAVVQFKVEAFSCIDAIDYMRQREIAAPERSPTDVASEFADNILISDSPVVTPDEIEFARDPYTVTIEPETDQAWREFILQIQEQYAVFASIYDRLESGSLLAADAVSESAKHAEMLTVQMAVFSKIIADNPPELLQYRHVIATKLTELKTTYQQMQAEGEPEDNLVPLRTRASELLGEWEEIKRLENELFVNTVTPCLKAASLGKDLKQLTENYDALDIDTLNSLIARFLNTASSITGNDYSSLKQRTETLLGEIKADAVLSPLVDQVLSDVGGAITGRNPGSDNNRTDVDVSPLSFWQKELDLLRASS